MFIVTCLFVQFQRDIEARDAEPYRGLSEARDLDILNVRETTSPTLTHLARKPKNIVIVIDGKQPSSQHIDKAVHNLIEEATEKWGLTKEEWTMEYSKTSTSEISYTEDFSFSGLGKCGGICSAHLVSSTIKNQRGYQIFKYKQ